LPNLDVGQARLAVATWCWGWLRPWYADTWCKVCPALGARGEPARLAAALGRAGLQTRVPSQQTRALGVDSTAEVCSDDPWV